MKKKPLAKTKAPSLEEQLQAAQTQVQQVSRWLVAVTKSLGRPVVVPAKVLEAIDERDEVAMQRDETTIGVHFILSYVRKPEANP